MAELPEDKRKASEAIQASLHRMASKVLEAPLSQREAVYEDIRENFSRESPELNISDEYAADFAANYMNWLRALVSIIEDSGGGRGGTA
jgi:hypothetical protein